MEQIILFVIFGILGNYLFGKFRESLSPAKSRQDSSQRVSNKPKNSFVAMRYYAIILNRTFRVWVTEKYVCGAKVGSAITIPPPNRGPEWDDPEFYVNPYYEEKYSTFYDDRDMFLTLDKANFRISRDEIIRIDYKKYKFGMGSVPYSGKIILRTKNSGSIEFILLGKQDHEAVSKMILGK